MKWPLIFLLFFSSFDLSGQCTGNILSNGSFNSAEGEAVVASGWTGQSSPDVNNAVGPLNTSSSYVWTGTPLASVDGGTWQNLFSDSESLEQTLNVFSGESYTLLFEYAAQGIVSPMYTFTGPVGVNIYIDNTLVAVTPSDVSQFSWETYSYTFTPTNNIITLKLSASTYNYVAIDGVCFGLESMLAPYAIIEMPNVFSPNNDGVNDYFIPRTLTNAKNASLMIVNRWGELVYETDNAMIGWDGKFKDKMCSDGVYFWIVNYTTSDDKQLTCNGYLHLIRD